MPVRGDQAGGGANLNANDPLAVMMVATVTITN